MLRLASILVLITACRVPPTTGNLEFEEIKIAAPVETIDFEIIKQEILKPQCIQCHPAYSNYYNVKDDLVAIQNSIVTNRMPKDAPPLRADLKLLLTEWIEIGAPSKVVPTPVNLAPNWKSLSEKVFFPKCAQCHNPAGQAAFLDLSSYQALKELPFDADYLFEVITDPEQPMPPTWSNIAPVETDQLEVMQQWFELGLPEN